VVEEFSDALPGQGPAGHWKTMTFVAALRGDAITAPRPEPHRAGLRQAQTFLRKAAELTVEATCQPWPLAQRPWVRVMLS
jgi:hypothetical protein